MSCGGAETYIWPGGGITVMVDVLAMPSGSFGYVPTPALVAPIEFTMRLSDYAKLGGHLSNVRPVDEVVTPDIRRVSDLPNRSDPMDRSHYSWPPKGQR